MHFALSWGAKNASHAPPKRAVRAALHAPFVAPHAHKGVFFWPNRPLIQPGIAPWGRTAIGTEEARQ